MRSLERLSFILAPIILDFTLRASGNYSIPVWVIHAIDPPSIGFLIPLSITLYIQCRPPAAERYTTSSHLQTDLDKSYGAANAGKAVESIF